jgi:hypothetical protein
MKRGENPMQEYKFSSEFDERGHKKFKLLYFGTIGGVFVMLFVLTIFGAINNPDCDLTVVLICLFGMMLFMTLLAIVGYFLGLKLQKQLMAGYYILLDEDSISLKSDRLMVMSVMIKRNEISEIVESKSYLKVVSKQPKLKTILVPTNLEGYDEIKMKLQGWTAYNK